MRLYYTPRSHFSRKVRILLDAWGIAVELVDVGNVAEMTAGRASDNPLMKVPTLVDGDAWIIDSDHIARYLVKQHDPNDRFAVLADDLDTLNARAIMNGIMSSEVEIILARRTGIDVDGHARFTKLRQSIENGLGWLEARSATISTQPCYLGFHLVCLWEHLVLYDLVSLSYPRLRDRVEAYSELPFVSPSKPF